MQFLDNYLKLTLEDTLIFFEKYYKIYKKSIDKSVFNDIILRSRKKLDPFKR